MASGTGGHWGTTAGVECVCVGGEEVDSITTQTVSHSTNELLTTFQLTFSRCPF